MVSQPARGSRLWNVEATRQNRDQLPWDDHTTLLSAAVNALHEIMFQLQWSNFCKQDPKDQRKSSKPKRIPMIEPPGYRKPEPRMLTKASEVAEFMKSVHNPEV